MSIVPVKEFEFESISYYIDRSPSSSSACYVAVEFDSINFPNVLLILGSNPVKNGGFYYNYYLYDTVKQKNIFSFPQLTDPFKLSTSDKIWEPIHDSSNNASFNARERITATYNSKTQILLYSSRKQRKLVKGTYDPRDDQYILDIHKLSYDKFKFKNEKINRLENLINLTLYDNNYYISNRASCSQTLVIINSKFEITAEFKYCTVCPIRGPRRNYVESKGNPTTNIIFIKKRYNSIVSIFIYNYVNNIVLDTIELTQDNLLHQGCPYVYRINNNYIIGNSFYTFKKEDDILPENKCVSGHTQFCAKCIKTDLKTPADFSL